jgi:hypothetical protein
MVVVNPRVLGVLIMNFPFSAGVKKPGPTSGPGFDGTL